MAYVAKLRMPASCTADDAIALSATIANRFAPDGVHVQLMDETSALVGQWNEPDTAWMNDTVTPAEMGGDEALPETKSRVPIIVGGVVAATLGFALCSFIVLIAILVWQAVL